jgi:hypothetical protein
MSGFSQKVLKSSLNILEVDHRIFGTKSRPHLQELGSLMRNSSVSIYQPTQSKYPKKGDNFGYISKDNMKIRGFVEVSKS